MSELMNLQIALPLIIGVFLCLLPFVMWKWEPSPISPIYLTMLYLLAAYPIKLLAVRMSWFDVLESYPGLLWDDTLVTQILWMLDLGIVAYLIGYYRPPQVLIRLVERLNLPTGELTPSWPAWALVVFSIGLASLAIQFATGAWSSFAGLGENWNPGLNQLYAYTFNYMWYGVMAASLWLVGRQRKGGIGIVVCLLILGIAIASTLFVFGSKTWLISTVVWFMMAFHMSGRRLPAVGTVVGALLITFAAFLYVPTFRQMYSDRYGGYTANVTDFLVVGSDTMSALGNSSIDVSAPAATFLARFAGIDNAAIIVKYVPRTIDYLYFKQFLYLPLSFIPRIIFPNKPTSDVGTVFTVAITGGVNGGSSAPHPVGEGYYNWGWMGVIILFWIWGSYQSLWYRGFYLPRKGSPLASLIYAVFILDAINFGGWIISLFLKLPGQLIVLIPCVLIMSLTARKTQIHAC